MNLPNLRWIILLSGAFLAGGAQAMGQQPAPAATPTPPLVIPPGIEKFVVNTNSPENREIPFYVRPPTGYLKHPGKGPYRVLFLCPVYNGDGLVVFAEAVPLLDLAERKQWFVVVPTFKNKGDVRDRKTCYYYPEKFSGKAVCEALDLIKRKYPISTNGLLLQGYSGGAQFVHRFAIWAPDRVAAVAVNSASWFDHPTAPSAQMAWLFTIGDSDPAYDETLKMMDELRKTGAAPVLRTYLGLDHSDADGGDVRSLTCAFLSFYDEVTKSQLGRPKSLLATKYEPPLSPRAMPLVGDLQEWQYQKNSAAAAEEISEDARVYLPSEAVAQIWGKPEAPVQATGAPGL